MFIMTSPRKYNHQSALRAIRGEQLPKRHISGFQAIKAGELATAIDKTPLVYIEARVQDPMQQARDRREEVREPEVLDVIEEGLRQVRQAGRELIDPETVAWPKPSVPLQERAG
jgi:hypothetical protein